jgi:hypothetical protein
MGTLCCASSNYIVKQIKAVTSDSVLHSRNANPSHTLIENCKLDITN